MGDLILETRGLTKEFRGFTAVQAVDLKIRRGTIHAVIGPNGAGKPTVFNLLTSFSNRLPGARRSQGAKLSGGEQQMLAIGRMLRAGAKLLFWTSRPQALRRLSCSRSAL